MQGRPDEGRTLPEWASAIGLLFFALSYGSKRRKMEPWPLLLKSHPVSASSSPNWLNHNRCVVARFPHELSSAARRPALAPMIPRPATALISA